MMSRNRTLLLILSIISITFFSCEEEPETGTASKTVLVYFMGQNSLGNAIEPDIKELEEGFSKINKFENLLIFVDSYTNSRIIKIERDKSGQIVRKLINLYPEDINSVDPDVMRDIISFVFTTYPADSYGLILWSHGDGWAPKTRWIGQDYVNGISQHMDIKELKYVLENCPPLDFLFFDACSMQTIEVAYELRSFADYIVGSVAETPGPGAPYHKILPAMFASGFNPELLVNEYYKYYDPWKSNPFWTYGGITISAIKTAYLEELAAETAKIIPVHTEELSHLNVSTIQKYDMRYEYCLYYDLNSFIKTIATNTEYNEWRNVLDKTIPYRRASTECYSEIIYGTFPIDVMNYGGVSGYIMQSTRNYADFNESFKDFEWYKASGWNQTVW